VKRHQDHPAPGKAAVDLTSKTPPQNLEAEQAVLGGIFLRSDLMDALLDHVGEDDFYSPAHRTIFQACLHLYQRNVPIDLVTLADHLQNVGQLEQVGGPVYLASLTESLVAASHAESYARIVRDKSILRRLIQAASEIVTSCYEGGQDVDKVLDESEQTIFSIAEFKVKSVFSSSKQLIQEVFEHLEKRVGRQELVTGVPTGYHKFDALTAGLQPSDMIIIAARPSMGKTAFALNIAMRSAILHEVPTAIFSLEMSKEQLMMRMLCAWGKVDLGRFRRGFLNDEDWVRLHQAADALSQAQIFIDDTPALGTLDLRARCRRLKSEKKLGLVVVDYLQLMRASRRIDSREQEISDISRNLKALAKELDIPIMALAQLNRKVEERSNRRPMLSDLRESGAIEQDADVIVFLYRDEVYNKQEGNPKKGIAEIIIGKQRNGPVGELELAYLSPFTAFENLVDVPLPSENIPVLRPAPGYGV